MRRNLYMGFMCISNLKLIRITRYFDQLFRSSFSGMREQRKREMQIGREMEKRQTSRKMLKKKLKVRHLGENEDN